MEIKVKKVLPFIKIIIGSLIFLTQVSVSSAASGTINVIPEKGDFQNGAVFEASINIDGGGELFNASKATVNVSENLVVESVTLGNCGFAFVDTPSVGALSYAGVILGGSSSKCTVYSLTLKVKGSNNGHVFISDGSIKSYQGASELLQSVKNSSYSFGGGNNQQTITQVINPTQPPLTASTGNKMYTLIYTINNDKASKKSNLTVLLDPSQPTQMSAIVTTLPEDPSVLAAIFENVAEGVHTLEVIDGDKVVSSEIVNVEGENREINVGVRPTNPRMSLATIFLIAVGLVVLVATGVLGYFFIWRKNHPTS